MVFKTIRVGSFDIKYEPFKDGDEQYPICDKDKNLLEYVKGSRTNGYYINPTTKERVDDVFMLVNGEPKDKFSITKETSRYKEVDENEREDLANPKQYKVICDSLLRELLITKKALKFGISFGGKSKPYIAIVSVNKLYNRLEMWISKAKKSDEYKLLAETEADAKKVEEMTMIINGIDKAKVEDLVEL